MLSFEIPWSVQKVFVNVVPRPWQPIKAPIRVGVCALWDIRKVMTKPLWLISPPLVWARLLHSRYFQGKQLCHGHMWGFTARLRSLIYLPSQAHSSRRCSNSNVLLLFLWSAVIRPSLGFLLIAMLILLQNCKGIQHLFSLTLIERNIFCYPVNLWVEKGFNSFYVVWNLKH